MTDTTDKLSLQQLKDVRELCLPHTAWRLIIDELISARDRLEAERQRADEEFILIGYAEDGKGFVYEPRHQDRISNPIAIYRRKES